MTSRPTDSAGDILPVLSVSDDSDGKVSSGVLLCDSAVSAHRLMIAEV